MNPKPKVDCRTCRHFQVVGRGQVSFSYRCLAKVFGCVVNISDHAQSYGEYIGCYSHEKPSRKKQRQRLQEEQLSLFDVALIAPDPDPEPKRDKEPETEQGRSPLAVKSKQLHSRKLGERFEVTGPAGKRLSLVCIDFGDRWVVGMDRENQQWICDCEAGNVVRHEWR